MLSNFEAILGAEVLEECLQQAQFVIHLSELVQKPEECDGSPYKGTIDEDNILCSMDVISPQVKFQNDLQQAKDTLLEAIQQIKAKKKYSRIADYVESYWNLQNNYQDFEKKVKEQHDIIPKMRRDVSMAKKEMEEEVSSKRMFMHRLSYELQNSKVRTKLEKSYVMSTIQNEIQKVQKRCNKEEEELEENCKNLSYGLIYEVKTDEQIEKYLVQINNELYDTLLHWKYKFFDDYKDKERQLHMLKNFRKMNLSKVEVVSAELKVDEEFLERDHQEKCRRQELYDLEKIKFGHSIIIQAWWRGTMVRRKLGKYSERSIDKADKKEKKKHKKIK